MCQNFVFTYFPNQAIFDPNVPKWASVQKTLKTDWNLKKNGRFGGAIWNLIIVPQALNTNISPFQKINRVRGCTGRGVGSKVIGTPVSRKNTPQKWPKNAIFWLFLTKYAPYFYGKCIEITKLATKNNYRLKLLVSQAPGMIKSTFALSYIVSRQ